MSVAYDLAGDPFAALFGDGRGVEPEPVRRHSSGAVYLTRWRGALALEEEQWTPALVDMHLSEVSAALGVKVVALWVLDDEDDEAEPVWNCDLYTERDGAIYFCPEPLHELLRTTDPNAEDLITPDLGWRQWRSDEVEVMPGFEHAYVTRYSLQHAGWPFDLPSSGS